MEEAKRSKNHSLVHIEPADTNALSIGDLLINKFDYVVRKNLYKPYKNSLAIYDLLRQIMVDRQNKIRTPIITLSCDASISGATIGGVVEKFMYTEQQGSTPVYRSDLKVIYINSCPDLAVKSYTHYQDFVNSVMADVIGITPTTFNMHRVNQSPDNVYFIGIDESILPDEQDALITKYNMNSFSFQTMQKKGVDKVMEYVIQQCKFDDVHVVINLASMASGYAPSVYREHKSKNGFDYDQMLCIVRALKKLEKLNSVDITGYNFGLKPDKEKHHIANTLTVRVIDTIINSLIDLKQKSINIFDEESRFLIWKRLDDKDPVGWLILRGMGLGEKEELIKAIDDDRIITVPINDEDEVYDAFVTTTTMKEQQEKSYYTAMNVYDCCLYPGEKLNMLFELLNSPGVQASPEFMQTNDTAGNQKNHYIQMNILTPGAGPETPGTIDQGPDAPGTIDQGPEAPGTIDQGPDAPGTIDQGPEAPGTIDQGSEALGTIDQGPDPGNGIELPESTGLINTMITDDGGEEEEEEEEEEDDEEFTFNQKSIYSTFFQ
jgi:arginase family enzyme